MTIVPDCDILKKNENRIFAVRRTCVESVFLCGKPAKFRSVYGDELISELEKTAGASPEIYTSDSLASAPEGTFAGVKRIFSTWGMPALTDEEIGRYFPSLECVYYAAGTVQAFARPFLERGVRVFSAWAANAVPVAEYTVSQILLANKGFFRACRTTYGGGRAEAKKIFSAYPGNYSVTVGIIGVGMIGSMVAEALKRYDVSVIGFDPFLSDEKAARLGVEKVGLPELFSRSNVVTNHLANNPRTVGMLTGELFELMPPSATFINTGRGAQVDEAGLIRVLTERQDLTAILDVTMPEPPAPDSPFYTLKNCFLTPHIAGSSGNEVRRMAEYMLAEYRRVENGEAPLYEVNLKMLETMA